MQGVIEFSRNRLRAADETAYWRTSEFATEDASVIPPAIAAYHLLLKDSRIRSKLVAPGDFSESR